MRLLHAGRHSWHGSFAAVLTAVLGGGVVACGCRYLPFELKPLAGGLVCVVAGALAGSAGRGYLVGVLLALSWGLTEARLAGLDPTDIVWLALLAGLFALGPVGALGAILCDAHCQPVERRRSPTAPSG